MSFLPTDIPDLRGYDSGVVLSNLSRLRAREDRLGEQTLTQLWELAGAALQDAAGDPDTLTSILLALQSDGEEQGTAPGDGVLPEYRALLDRLRTRDGLYARLVLYRYLDVRNPAGCCTVLPLREVPPTVRGRVAYMTGSLADKAFLHFAEQLPGCRAADARSFVDACEEVYNGLCQFCILPLESAEEGRLAAFSRLIVRYGLQTVAVCDVAQRGVNGTRRTCFALLCAGDGEPVFRCCRQEVAPRYFELVHIARTAPSVADVLAVADFCGMHLVRADTLSAADAAALSRGREDDADEQVPHDGALPVSLLFDGSPGSDRTGRGTDLSVFLRWLTLEAGDDLVTGCYT